MALMSRLMLGPLAIAAGALLVADGAFAQSSVQPQNLGIVQAPTAGSVAIPLNAVPLPILHAAEVAFKRFEGGGSITAAQVDRDDVQALYEIKACRPKVVCWRPM
jgi:hypothetical protein